MNLRRIRQVCAYGWSDALVLSQGEETKKGRITIFLDILCCFFKYNVWSNQYKKEKLHLVPDEQKKEICLAYKEKNTKRDQWVKGFFENYKFLNKWSSFKYEQSADLQAKRRAAYKRQYGLGENCFIGYDVIFHRHHYEESKIVTGRDCLIAEHSDIDYTGGITMGDRVSLSEGVKILTHNHEINENIASDEKGTCVKTPLNIQNRVWIGARTIIQAGVRQIGRYAIIGSGSIVKSKVMPYSIVMGNPSQVVGYRFTPEEVEQYEKDNLPENERIDIKQYAAAYKKFYADRRTEKMQKKMLADYMKSMSSSTPIASII